MDMTGVDSPIDRRMYPPFWLFVTQPYRGHRTLSGKLLKARTFADLSLDYTIV